MKIYTVLSFEQVRSMSMPVIHYFSLEKTNCENYIKEFEEKNSFYKGARVLEELESDMPLKHLFNAIIW